VLKRLAKSYLPGPYGWLQQRWSRHQIGRFQRRLDRAAETFIASHGLRVTGGPFAGMRYVRGAVCSALLPKLIGSYEAEIAPAIEAAIQRRYATVVDIGAAEGYYAVGLACRLPDAHVHAFERDPAGRELCATMAAENGVADRVAILGDCDAAALVLLPLEGSLVICDCEGCEYDLLRPDLVPALSRCDLIVELHDFLDPRITPTIQQRFAKSHTIELIPAVARRAQDYPQASCLPPSERAIAVDEIRPQQVVFAVMRRRAQADDGGAGAP
jgi:hypothetical protein